MKIYKTYTCPAALDYMPLYKQITDAPSVLIAGVPGSGKSVLLNGLIYNLLASETPSNSSMFFIDPKRVELNRYRRLPHCKGIAKDPAAALDILYQISDIMDTRYIYMERRGMVKIKTDPIYLFIDEFADIMLSDFSRPFTKELQHLLQLGRAANIHVIACTQIPNRKIIPANLQAVFNEKIALRCISAIESRQIINKPGAEKLPKYGKAIWLNSEGYKTIDNIPFIDDDRINDRINFWRQQRGKIHISL